MERAFRQYMPSPGSMAAALYSVEDALTNQYRDHFEQMNSFKWKPNPAEKPGNRDLNALLCNSGKEYCLSLARMNDIPIKNSLRKEQVVSELAQYLPTAFKKHLQVIGANELRYLLSFLSKPVQPVPKDAPDKATFHQIAQFGWLFRVKDAECDQILIPGEIEELLRRSPLEDCRSTAEGNDRIARMAERILYYYGVLPQRSMEDFLASQWEACIEGREPALTPGGVNSVKPECKDRIRRELEYRIKISGSMRLVELTGRNYGTYYCHPMLYNPDEILDEQNRRPEVGWAALSPGTLLKDSLPDKTAFSDMVRYLSAKKNMSVSPIREMLAQWACFIRNDIPLTQYINVINKQVHYGNIDEINRFLRFFSERFDGRLVKWILKGHTSEYVFMKFDKRLLESEYIKQGKVTGIPSSSFGETAIAAQPGMKPGRNDPCFCGSGKKYKKCCGRSEQ